MKKKRVRVAKFQRQALTITTILILFLIFILLIVGIYFLIAKPKVPLLSPSNIKVNYTGVYQGFSLNVGYYQNISGRTIILWNSSGSYYTTNGTNLTGPITSNGNGTDGKIPRWFIPTIGYYHPYLGGKIGLWNASGQFIVFNGTTWNNANSPAGNGTDGKIPRWFIPTIGYYHGFGGRVVLWNASGQFIAWNGSTWTNPSTHPNLPAGKVPVVAYYTFFDRPLSCEFSPVGDLNNDNIINNADTSILNSYISSPTNPNSACGDLNGDNIINGLDATYLTNLIQGSDTGGNAKIKLYLWFNDNGAVKLYVYNDSGIPKIQSTTGLPNNVPTGGYFDGITNKVILWFGSNAYESANATNFTQVQIACIPGPVVCEQWGPCSQELQSRNCFDGCLNHPQTQSCSCYDSDGDLDYLSYYQFGNVSYQIGVTPIVKNDTCLNNQNLTEWFCSINQPFSLNYTCPNGCANGFCNGTPITSCEDSDNGLIYNTKGRVVSYFNNQLMENISDICINNYKLKEGYCDEDNLFASIYYNCTTSCTNGTCVGGDIIPPSIECVNGRSSCTQDNKYILCVNGQWSDPITPPQGECTTSLQVECTSDVDCNSDEFCNVNNRCQIKSSEGGEGRGAGWIILIIIIIIVILAVIGAIIYIIVQRNKLSNQPKSGPALGSMPRSPPAPPGSMQGSMPKSLPPSSISSSSQSKSIPQRVFEKAK